MKTLRQRLGWSAAELARRLGLKTDTVLAWEDGVEPFDPDVRHKLQGLLHDLEFHATRTQAAPAAEVMMKDLGIDQILTDLSS